MDQVTHAALVKFRWLPATLKLQVVVACNQGDGDTFAIGMFHVVPVIHALILAAGVAGLDLTVPANIVPLDQLSDDKRVAGEQFAKALQQLAGGGGPTATDDAT